MMKIIFATGNAGKMKEIRQILNDVDATIESMKEAGIDIDIVEDGKSFEENALIKARAVANELKNIGEDNYVVFADDSGLEVDYMDKAPGIYSARFLGEDTSYTIKNNYIINKLEGVKKEDRTARFVCAIACVAGGAGKETKEFSCLGTIEGYIGYEEAGENGFGYDPIFMVDEYGCTTAQLSPEQKNAISHRGKALTTMKNILIENKVIA